jgi:hypothetical protein
LTARPGAAAANDGPASLERLLQTSCLPLGSLEEVELVFLRLERVLDELILDVLLVSEGEALFDQG